MFICLKDSGGYQIAHHRKTYDHNTTIIKKVKAEKVNPTALDKDSGRA
jgi:hypothetical protein